VLLSAHDLQAVDGVTESGRARLAALRRDGYTCVPATDRFYRCTKFLHDVEIPESVATRVREELANDRIELEPGARGVELVNDSPSLREWEIRQNLRVNAAAYDHWSYLQLRAREGSLSKLRVGDRELLVRSCERLGRVLERRAGSVSYLVEAAFGLVP
ncbi:MAG: hypothetical protein HY075_16735, partial [Deltaproteobacteria bacterium]|nr:hypothetical protein [Deltaproteobacteria bacterium]